MGCSFADTDFGPETCDPLSFRTFSDDDFDNRRFLIFSMTSSTLADLPEDDSNEDDLEAPLLDDKWDDGIVVDELTEGLDADRALALSTCCKARISFASRLPRLSRSIVGFHED